MLWAALIYPIALAAYPPRVPAQNLPPSLPPVWFWPSTDADHRCAQGAPAGFYNETCSARQDYIIVADNSDSVGDSFDNITSFMHAFIDQLDYASGGPRLAIITFSGPPIGQGSNWAYDPRQATNTLIDFSDDTRSLHSAVRTRALHYCERLAKAFLYANFCGAYRSKAREG